jgi:hypothetical protein
MNDKWWIPPQYLHKKFIIYHSDFIIQKNSLLAQLEEARVLETRQYQFESDKDYSFLMMSYEW